MTTEDDLGEAFSGESQTMNRYLFFAQKARSEGKDNIARLFRAAAEAERVHARNHVQALGMVKSTQENLQVAIDGENYEYTEMYPAFIQNAKKEGDSDAFESFQWAKQVEEKHESLYKEAKEAVTDGQDMKEDSFFVCQGCGYTADGEAPEKCPVCGAPKKRFKEIK